MVVLTRIDPARNLHRFYVVNLGPTLLGEWALWREWGRIGSPGTVRTTSFEREEDAQKAEQQTITRRLRRGYSMRHELRNFINMTF
jgi:predicted DNA-binding WGR domain protein